MRARVLVVDDDPDMRLAIGEVLLEQGLVVDLAGNGRQALDHGKEPDPG